MIAALISLAALLIAALVWIWILIRKLSAGALETSELRSENALINERLSNAESSRAQLEDLYYKEQESWKQQQNQQQTLYDHTVRQYESRIAELQKLIDDRQHEHEERIKHQEESFALLAHNIMEQQTQTLRRQSEEHIGQLLSPLKNDIENFRKEVNECYSTEARERFSLQQRIKELIEANQSIGKEARELSTALRGNTKKQGDWGELVLETILEKSGLRKDEEYTVQYGSENGTALRDEQGRALRPDVVVHYPGNRVMVIDSKVSLTAFVEYVNAEDDETRESWGKQHVASVVKHINELADKGYQDYVGTEKLDFVMMFIPNEAAYAAAMTRDNTLWQKAYDKRVLIVSPTQLVGSLRIIEQLWSHDRQTRNAIEIAEQSGKMYDKFVGFVEDMAKIDKAIQSTASAYDAAMKKLKSGTGNLIKRAEQLRALGIKAAKKLPSAEE